jgi:hypothetical protein
MYILDTITYEIKEATHNFSSGRFISYETELEALNGAVADIDSETGKAYAEIARLQSKKLDVCARISALNKDSKPF